MKHFLSIIAIVILSLLSFSSCGSNDENTNPLIGKKFYWSITYSSSGLHYKVLDFVSDSQFKFYETDQNFMITSMSGETIRGNYTFDQKKNAVDFQDSYIKMNINFSYILVNGELFDSYSRIELHLYDGYGKEKEDIDRKYLSTMTMNTKPE